jgi:hypothetical protein
MINVDSDAIRFIACSVGVEEVQDSYATSSRSARDSMFPPVAWELIEEHKDRPKRPSMGWGLSGIDRDQSSVSISATNLFSAKRLSSCFVTIEDGPRAGQKLQCSEYMRTPILLSVQMSSVLKKSMTRMIFHE